MSRLGREADDRQQEPRGQAGLPVAVRSSEGLGSSAWCPARLLPGKRRLGLRPLKRQCDERQATAPNLPLLADAHAPEQPAADLELRAGRANLNTA